MAGWLDGFLSSGNWIAPTLLVGATAYSANSAAKANKQAAQIAQQTSRDQIAAIDRGTALSKEQFQQIQDATAPAVTYQRSVVAAPTVLQPWQQTAVDDARRQTVNSLTAAGMGGSGRSMVAAVRKVEGDVTGQYLQGNQQRADTAASSLASQYFGAASNAARADQTAGIYDASAIGQQGQTTANATTADATLRGKALGDIATVVNDTWKAGRRGEYQTDKAQIGQG